MKSSFSLADDQKVAYRLRGAVWIQPMKCEVSFRFPQTSHVNSSLCCFSLWKMSFSFFGRNGTIVVCAVIFAVFCCASDFYVNNIHPESQESLSSLQNVVSSYCSHWSWDVATLVDRHREELLPQWDMGLLCKSFKGTLFCISSIIQRRGKPGNETRSHFSEPMLSNVFQRGSSMKCPQCTTGGLLWERAWQRASFLAWGGRLLLLVLQIQWTLISLTCSFAMCLMFMPYLNQHAHVVSASQASIII